MKQFMKQYNKPISLEKLTKLYEVEMRESIKICTIEEYPLTVEDFENECECEELIYAEETLKELITKTKFVCLFDFKDNNFDDDDEYPENRNSEKVRIFVSEDKETWYHILNGEY